MATLLDPRKWNPHVGEYVVTIDGVVAPPGVAILPDAKKYEARVLTLCADELVSIEATPHEQITVAEYARLIQIVASIAHVTKRACRKCLRAYQTALTPHERRFLKMAEPKLGEILGLGKELATGNDITEARRPDRFNLSPVSPAIAGLIARAGGRPV